MTHILDGDRLLADLQAAGKVFNRGEWPKQAARYFEHRGIQRAWRILAAAVEDGEYDWTEPGDDTRFSLGWWSCGADCTDAEEKEGLTG